MLDDPTTLLKKAFSTPNIDRYHEKCKHLMVQIFSRSGFNPQFRRTFKEVLKDHRKERQIDEVREIVMPHMCRMIQVSYDRGQRVGYMLSLYTRSEQFIDTFGTPESEELDVGETDYPENRGSDARSAVIWLLTLILRPSASMAEANTAALTITYQTSMKSRWHGNSRHQDVLLEIVCLKGYLQEEIDRREI